jgi:hemerythrin
MAWKEGFSVGIPELDGQHQTMEGFIALVETAVMTKQRWSTVHSALVQLTDFVRIHFAVEESLMRIHGYPELERHTGEHLQFADRLRELQEKSLRLDVSEEMVAFLRKWQEAHIALSDSHCAAYFPSAGVVTGARAGGKNPEPASGERTPSAEVGRDSGTEAQARDFEWQVENHSVTAGDSKKDGSIKAHLDGLVRSMKCSKDFACAKSNFEALCRARDIGLQSSLVCLEEDYLECDYRLKSDVGRFCQCPIRVCLAKAIDQLPVDSRATQ